MPETTAVHPVERFSRRVQAAQTAYCDTMAGHWRRVLAGDITEREYWAISKAEPLRRCHGEIAAATAEYDAARPARPPKRRWRWWLW